MILKKLYSESDVPDVVSIPWVL